MSGSDGFEPWTRIQLCRPAPARHAGTGGPAACL